MGGIDLLNMCSNLYKYHMRSCRWYIYLWWHSIVMTLVNAWMLYRRYHKEIGTDSKQILPLRKFQSACAQALTTAGRGKARARGRPSLAEAAALAEQPPPRKRPAVKIAEDVRKDNFDHFPFWDNSRQRCKLCPSGVFSFVKCGKCNVHLCLNKTRNCFLAYHK
jgi:hypothetical protein